jgi:protocatechuate 3,4-dioxygenase beta subunit
MRPGQGSPIWCWVIISILLGAANSGRAGARWSIQATLRGKVVDAGGAPVEGVMVRLYRDRAAYGDTPASERMVSAGEAATPTDGSFSFSVTAGDYTLQSAPSGDALSPRVAEPVSVRLAAGQVADISIEVRQSGLLEVTVVNAASNRALPQARAQIRSQAGEPQMSAASDADGGVRMPLLPGTYEIGDVRRNGYTYEGPHRPLVIEEGRTTRLTMVLTPNVHGVVRDPRGLPVSGARVRMVGAGREDAISDGEGRFDIAWDRQCQFRDAASYSLVIQHEQRNLAATLEIGRHTGALDVRLHACPVLTGRLVDAGGRGIAGAGAYVTLNVPNWGDTPLSEEVAETDAGGRFEIRAVPPTGQCTLHTWADAYGSRDMTVPVKTAEGLSFDVGTLTLPPANLSIAGRARDAWGNPMARAMVFGWGAGQPVKINTQTDAEGLFTLAGVCPGKVNLRVDANLGGGRHLRAQTLAEAGDTNLLIGSRGLFAK